MIIGEPAIIDATIRASTIKINGHVKGELFASKRIEIMSKGRVKGSVTNLAGCLIIHDGGVVEGVCSIVTEEKMKSLLPQEDRKSTRLNSSHKPISYAVFCSKKKTP